MTQPLVRLKAGVVGSDSKVEVFVDNAWRDISHLCAGGSAFVECAATEATTITLKLAFGELIADGVLDDASLRVLEKVLKAHREAGA